MTSNNSAVFFGSGPVASKSLELLLKHTKIEAVVTKPRPAHHKGNVPVLELAEEKNLPIHTISTKSELDELMAKRPFSSQYGILIDFGIIVSQKTIDSFDKGIVNSHFSLLPKLRGADPITWSIINGDDRTGVSLMLIDAGMDTGQLIAQQEILITPNDTSSTLTDKLINLSDELLQKNLDQYLSGEIRPYDQPSSITPSYSRKLVKSDGVIDWSEPAELIERKIRALSDWPKSKTKLGNLDVIITSAHVVDKKGEPGKYEVIDDQLIIYTTNKALAIDNLKPAGKKDMPVKAFLAGYKSVI